MKIKQCKITKLWDVYSSLFGCVYASFQTKMEAIRFVNQHKLGI